MKVDYPSLKKINEKLIYAQLTGFGEDDPRPAFDMVLQAEAGFLYMTGEPGRPSVKMPVALIDILAAHQMKEGILIALLKRAATGEGSLVRTSLYEAALASLANQASNWLMAGHIPQAMGTLHPNIAPYGEVFHSADDKPLVLAVGTDKQFVNLCKSLDINIFEDKKFKANTQRVIHRTVLGGHLSEAMRKHTSKELERRFIEFQVPYARIRDMREVFEPPQAQAMILEEKMPDGKVSHRVKTVAFQVD
jgi:crotonobetainyl-CoA:carnitine CoA-transferase CaiB-like acyl-CoA transferase